jgi:hypothetical protein
LKIGDPVLAPFAGDGVLFIFIPTQIEFPPGLEQVTNPVNDVERPLSRPLFRLDWVSSTLPSLQAALQSPHIFVAALLKFLRQTGA